MSPIFRWCVTALSRTHIRLLILILLVVAPAFGLIVFTAYEQRASALEETRQEAAQTSQDMRLRTQDLLNHAHMMLENLIRTPEVQGRIPVRSCNKLLADTLRLHPQYLDLLIADPAGRVRCSAEPALVASNIGDTSYFRNAVKVRRFAVGDWQASDGKGRIFLAHPWLDETGSLRGVVAISLDPGWLSNVLRHAKLPAGSSLTLFDSKGVIVFRHPDLDGSVGRRTPDWAKIRASVSTPQTGVVEETQWSKGMRLLTSLLPLVSDGHGGNLYLRLSIPNQASYAGINRSQNRNLVLMGLAALLALTIGWFAADRLLLRRIWDLSRTARHWADGNMDAHATLPPDESELGQLSATFDSMGEAIKLREARIRRTEEELRHSNRALGVLSAVNRSLVRAEDEATLLDQVCHEIVRVGRYPLAWVGYAEEGQDKRIRTVAKAGDDDGYLDALDISWDDQPTGQGPSGTAIRTGTSIVVRDILADPRFVRWRAEAVKHGFASTIGLPLVINGTVAGALRIYAPEPDAFDEEEVKLLEELAGDLGYGISNLRNTQTRRRIEAELDHQHNYDALTGLANRTLFQDRLRQDLLHAGRSGSLLAVLLVNLDRFKAVNESLGHSAGDALLKHVGQRLAACLREGDTVARMSGDEFAIIMSDVAKEEDVAPVARKLIGAVTQPLSLGGREVVITASAGISLFPKDGNEAEALLHNADAAKHRAKSTGGDAFLFYAREMNESASARFGMESDLRRALERDELLMHYQPKVNLRSGKLTGAEALVRWRHPTIGMVPPDDFIPLAEQTGLIRPLGQWVIGKVCEQLRIWRDAGLPVLPVAVNLSAHQFHQANLASLIKHSLSVNRLDAGLINLEITESALMDDVEAAVATLRELKKIGLKLSLDDFGTGYSSLSYLKRFPIDDLKIDRAFVRDLTRDPDDAEICIAIIGLAHNLRLTVVAEGVETAEQMNYLRLHDCDEMQGFYFSRPLPAEEFAKLLADGTTLAFAA